MYEFLHYDKKEQIKFESATSINHKRHQREVYIAYLIDTLDRAISVEEKRQILGATFDVMNTMIEQKFMELEVKYRLKEQNVSNYN